MRIDPSGAATVFSSMGEQGQGHETTIAQIVASQTGIPFEKITVIHGDTLPTPYGFGTGSSRSSVVLMPSAWVAATKMRDKLLGIAARQLGVVPEKLEIDEGKVFAKEKQDQSIAIMEIIRTAYGAIHLLEEVIATGRAFADAHHLLGLSYSLVGQQDSALAQLDRALALNPYYVEALVHRALVLNELGREAEADAAFRRAAQIGGVPRRGFPAHVAAKLANHHARLGDAYLESGGLATAIDQYQAALALGPAFHDLRYKLGRMLLEAGRALDAREQFEIIVRARPNYLDAAAMLGLACYLAGDGLAAKAVWEDCRERRPEDPRVEAYLAMLARNDSATQVPAGAAASPDGEPPPARSEDGGRKTSR